MKKTCLLALSAMAAIMGLASCGGGGDDSGSGTSTTSTTATASTEGIWTGTVRSSVTNQSQTATLIALPTGELRMFWANCVQLVATTSISSNFFSGSGTAYAPDGSQAACPTAVTFPNATSLATLTVNGQVTTGSSLIGTYSAGGDTGSYNLTYSSAYARVGTLARLVGNYSNGTVSMTIDANGTITGTIGGTGTLSGTVSTIDTTKNAYRVSLVETVTATGSSSSTTSSSTTGTTTTTTTTTTGTSTPTTTTLSGLATLIDYSTGTDNYLLVSVTNTTAGFAIPLIRQ